MQKVIVQVDWYTKIILIIIAVILAGLLAKPYLPTRMIRAEAEKNLASQYLEYLRKEGEIDEETYKKMKKFDKIQQELQLKRERYLILTTARLGDYVIAPIPGARVPMLYVLDRGTGRISIIRATGSGFVKVDDGFLDVILGWEK